MKWRKPFSFTYTREPIGYAGHHCYRRSITARLWTEWFFVEWER
jgi:hypothetical protein